MSETKTMHLGTGDHFSLQQTGTNSLLEGLSVFVRNNGEHTVLVSTDGSNILITVEKKAK